MKGFVITIEDLPQSVSVAERCKKSAEKFGLSTELFPAITPQAKPRELLRKLRINDQYFKDDIGSRPDNVIATFLSHYRLQFSSAYATGGYAGRQTAAFAAMVGKEN